MHHYPLIATSETTPATTAGAPVEPVRDDSPEARMNRRFPQKIRAGDLIGLPMIEYSKRDLGEITAVVRDARGKISLIVLLARRFGWSRRPIAVPIEVVGILGRQVVSLDMTAEQFKAAPTWSEGVDKPIPEDEIIRIALTKS